MIMVPLQILTRWTFLYKRLYSEDLCYVIIRAGRRHFWVSCKTRFGAHICIMWLAVKCRKSQNETRSDRHYTTLCCPLPPNTNTTRKIICLRLSDEALRYKPEGRGFDSDGVTGIFHWHNPSGRTMALRLTQPLTEMTTRNISWGIKAAGA
jgi:hypothetical protein